MNRGADKHPLAQAAGQLENGAGHMAAGGFIQQAVFPFSGQNFYVVTAGHVVEQPRVNPGGVDNRPGEKLPLAGNKPPALRGPGQSLYLGVKGKLHPIDGGAFAQAQGELKGAYNARGFRQQGPGYRFGKVWLQGPGLVPGKQREAWHAVFQAPAVQGLQLGQVPGA